MKQVPHTPNSDVPDNQPARDSAPARAGLLTWLKHFALYLSAVAVACVIGFFFLWQLPIIQNPSQLLRNTVDTAAPKSLTAVVAPVTTPTRPQGATIQESANPPTAISGQQPTAGEITVATATPPAPETTGDPSAAAPASEQPATPPDDQPPTEEVPPPTPQAEIEQLLAEAQQQMNSRRFTAPASGNALHTYQRVLELQPNHPTALDGIQRIATYYQDVADQSLQQGRLDESLAYIGRGLRAAPKNQGLLNLRREVLRLAKQREQEQRQRQALLEEMQRQQTEREYQEQLRQRTLESQQPWWRQQPNYNDNSGFNQR